MNAELLVIGLSHHTAPLKLRERLAVDDESLAEELRRVMDEGGLAEALMISTCNRVEIYAAAANPVPAVRSARRYLDSRAEPDTVDRYLYERWSTDAVRHAFRVTSSLDSMVVGEPQILGQVKQAYEAASAASGVGMLLGRCFTHAFGVAKRVRHETGIAQGSVSVSSIAGDLARKIFGDLHRRRVLLVGAGKMGEAAARNLGNSGAQLFVVNRSPERAEQLAHACGGTARGYELLAQELVQADVVITSTGSERFVISGQMMRDVVKARRRRPLFLIDIAVPRDVDPRVGEMDSVFLYDVDDLQQVASENLAARQREAESAEEIVDEEVQRFEQWRRSLELTPTIVALRERFQAVVRAELERTLPRLGELGDKERKALDKMCDAMVNKLLHTPVTELRNGTHDADAAHLIDAARRLFDLPTGPAQPQSADAGAALREEGAEMVRLAATGSAGQSGEGS